MKFITVLVSLIVIAQGSIFNVRRVVPLHNDNVIDNDDESAVVPEPQIAGGEMAHRGQFPWMAMIVMDNNYYCGGVLISQRWVLTGAECTDLFRYFAVYLGMQNWQNDEVDRLVMYTTNRIQHEDYDSSTFNHDISLIKLLQRVPLGDYIQLVSLPSYSMTSQDFVGVNATAAGWGQVSDTDTALSKDLMYVTLTVITNIICKETWGDHITDAILCTDASEGKSTCANDFGAPLVTEENILIGIQSFVASNGCQKGVPSVFTRVTSYLGWIEENSGIKITP